MRTFLLRRSLKETMTATRKPKPFFKLMTTDFKVPILPHLKKFVLAQLYEGQSEPLKVEEDSPLGRAVMSILIDKRQVKTSEARSTHNKEYDSILRLVLSQSMMERSPSIKKLARINLEFDEIFRQAIFIWVRAQNQNGVASYGAVENFLEFYKIDESEYTKDAAYQAWQRFKHQKYLKERKNRRREVK